MISAEETQAVAASLSVSLRAVVVALPFAVLTGYALARWRFPGRTILDALVHAPLVLPPVVVGFFLLLLFGLEGPFGRALDQWFGVRLVFTSEGASLAAGVIAFPLMVRAVRLAIEAIDPALEDAARTLGASAFDRFASITLPLAAPGILAAAVMGFAACLGEFGAVITFAASIPGETQTLPLAIYAALQEPGGEAQALRLAGLSLTLALGAVALSEALLRYGRAKAVA